MGLSQPDNQSFVVHAGPPDTPEPTDERLAPDRRSPLPFPYVDCQNYKESN